MGYSPARSPHFTTTSVKFYFHTTLNSLFRSQKKWVAASSNKEELLNAFHEILKQHGISLEKIKACAEENEDNKKKWDSILASRLEGQSGNYGMQIILGEESIQGLSRERFSVCELDSIAVKGKSEPVTIYTVFKKEKSDLDIELDDGVKDDEYLKTLKRTFKKLDAKLNPNLIFYISGVDILSTDKLGRLKVSREGCKKRDEMVFEFAQKNNIPIVTSMGGGYSEKIYDIVEAHCNTYKCMLQLTD